MFVIKNNYRFQDRKIIEKWGHCFGILQISLIGSIVAGFWYVF